MPTGINRGFLSTLSLRRATYSRTKGGKVKIISIHALLAESDATRRSLPRVWRNFYPRSPCGERRSCRCGKDQLKLFLSTLSLRRATNCLSWTNQPLKFLSTLSLRRATDTIVDQDKAISISIHALLAESDRVERQQRGLHNRISIHALLAESDAVKCFKLRRLNVFLSTLSLRRATACAACGGLFIKFLSTLSLRRATQSTKLKFRLLYRFLSTLSLRRATCYSLRHSAQSWYFYPRSPCGERQRT